MLAADSGGVCSTAVLCDLLVSESDRPSKTGIGVSNLAISTFELCELREPLLSPSLTEIFSAHSLSPLLFPLSMIFS